MKFICTCDKCGAELTDWDYFSDMCNDCANENLDGHPDDEDKEE